MHIQIYKLKNGKTYYLRAEYCRITNTEFTMNGRCWSFKDGHSGTYTTPSSPGPTLKMITGTTINIVLENNFVNPVQHEENCHNNYCEMDKLNIHTHGLHISPFQDDVFVDLKPRISNNVSANNWTYTYTIPKDHYPGIHWYHPHNQLIKYIQSLASGLINTQIKHYLPTQWIRITSNSFWIVWSNNYRIS